MKKTSFNKYLFAGSCLHRGLKNPCKGADFQRSYFNRIAFPLFLVLMVGCSDAIVFEKNYNLDPEGWHYNEIVLFEHNVSDTTALHDMFINVRNTTDYPYSNLFVFFQARFPDGATYRDTIEMTLADRHGKWKGRGLGYVKSKSFHFRRDVWFPLEGDYEFSIQHAMRDEYLRGISDIGLRIERIDAK